MNHIRTLSGPLDEPVTLPAVGIKALSAQATLLAAASVLLPSVAHLTGLPVRLLLPMHWPVILVGLIYGWRSGAIVGVAAPALSYVVSGMPYPVVLPAMTVELATYGLLAGFAREKLRWSLVVATGLGVIGGRLVFLMIAVVTGATGPSVFNYVAVALVPGLAAAVAQVVLLPMLAQLWVRRAGDH